MFRVLPLVAALVLAFWATAALSATDSYEELPLHPFTMNGCTVEPAHGEHANCDPVNLIFPGKATSQVREALRLRGWTPFGFGSTQYLHFTDETLVPQTVQLYRYDSLNRRYHIRLWQTQSGTVAGVHHEEGVFEHEIDMDWETAESFVAGQLCRRPVRCEQTSLLDEQSTTQGGDEEWRGWANNARVTVIRLR